MSVKLETKAIEQSTYIVRVSFKDEAGVAVIPKSMVWSLAIKDGTIVNSRQDVVGSPLAATMPVVLTDDDLALPDIANPVRYLLVEAVYDSATYGNNLSLREEFVFSITNLQTLT